MKPFRFEKSYYDAYYRNYSRQNPHGKMIFYKRLVEDALGRHEGLRVLDAGCAFGAFAAVVNNDWLFFGADVSSFALKQAHAAAPKARFFVADVSALPCKQQFDCITAFDCLEHVGNLESAVKNIKSLLRGGGWFIFVVPVYDGPTGPLIKILDRDPTHIYKKSREWWLQWVSRYFTIRTWRGIYRCLLPWGSYVHAPTTRFRKWTPAIAVVAQNI